MKSYFIVCISKNKSIWSNSMGDIKKTVLHDFSRLKITLIRGGNFMK